MPALPIVHSVDVFAPTSSVAGPDDAINVLPRRYKTKTKPVLDAMTSTLVEHVLEHEAAAEYAAAQSDMLRSTEQCLDGVADDHGHVRGPNETDEDFRTRVLGWRGAASRSDIAETIASILSNYSTSEAVLIDPSLDGWFVDDGSSTWSSHVWDSAGGGVQNYPDQVYHLRTNTGHLDAIAIPDGADGRAFGVLVPALPDTFGELMWVGGPTDTNCFVEDGLALVDMAFTSSFLTSAEEVFQAIANSIETTRAHGVRWFLLDDSRL